MLKLSTMDMLSLISNSFVREYDEDFIGTLTGRTNPLVEVGQEIRPFHEGHIFDFERLHRYGPGFWGPGYPSLLNGDVLQSDIASAARPTEQVSGFLHLVCSHLFNEDGTISEYYASELVSDVISKRNRLP